VPAFIKDGKVRPARWRNPGEDVGTLRTRPATACLWKGLRSAQPGWSASGAATASRLSSTVLRSVCQSLRRYSTTKIAKDYASRAAR